MKQPILRMKYHENKQSITFWKTIDGWLSDSKVLRGFCGFVKLHEQR